MSKFSILIIVIILVFIGCQNLTKYEKVKGFILEKNQTVNLDDYKTLVIINEKGTCINCNFSFSQAISKYVNRKDVLFLISSSGNQVDISPYLESEKNNVIFDYSNEFSKLKMVNSCAIMILKGQAIDTVIDIKLDNIQMSYDFFRMSLERN